MNNIVMIKTIIYLVLISSISTAWPQSCSKHEVSIIIENDSALTLGGGTDRYYSNGFEAAVECHTNVDQNDSHNNLAYRSLSWLDNHSEFSKISTGFKLGQKIYTSSNITLTPDQIDTDRDRPYAGWLYASYFHEAETLQDRKLKHEFSIGCVGPCSQADKSQTEWHEFFGFKKPESWDLQIENQLALQYFVEYKTNRYEVFPYVSLHPRYRASLGTVFDDVSLGGEFIVGDKSNIDLNKPGYEPKQWEWQIFLHNDIKLVAYNGTLQGSLFNNSSPHTVSTSRVVLENGVGIRLNYNGEYLFEYKFVGKSTEIEEQDWKFWDHKYGSFEFDFGF